MKSISVKFRSAFTMIELLFVMVILGIVASIGAEVISRVYTSYIIQRAQHRASIKTELASLQIANRLRYAIPGTLYRIHNDDSLENLNTTLTDIGDNYKGVQWVAYDGDSFEAITSNTDRRPGWSGFCDVNSSRTNRNNIETPGSNLQLTIDIINNLSSNPTVFSNITLYFPRPVPVVIGDPVKSLDVATRTIILQPYATPKKIMEHYKLAWSSYALVVENGDLYLYYDFAPIPNTPRGTSKSLLMSNVSTFKFKGAANTLRFKICQDENISSTEKVTSCKEKAIF